MTSKQVMNLKVQKAARRLNLVEQGKGTYWVWEVLNGRKVVKRFISSKAAHAFKAACKANPSLAITVK